MVKSFEISLGYGRVCTKPTSWILELDITAYFDSIVSGQLMEMIEKRISDGSVLQFIQKWIQVGVIDDGRLLVSETGTARRQTISPLLANIYLHHVLDECFRCVANAFIGGVESRFAKSPVALLTKRHWLLPVSADIWIDLVSDPIVFHKNCKERSHQQ
jgi:hypothetical protein